MESCRCIDGVFTCKTIGVDILTEKRFTVHILIEDYEVGENDLEGHMIEILDNGNRMTYKECCNLLNAFHEENEQLKQTYAQLKHRHSLLHDECIDAECDRDSYHKDVASLEKENEQLKFENKNLKAILNDFINILNRLQSNPTDKQTLNVARDMLQNMGKELKE